GVQQRHRPYAVLAFLVDFPGLLVLDESRLKIQQAGDDLQIVLHAVMYLAQEDLLLPQGRFHAGLGLLALANIEERANRAPDLAQLIEQGSRVTEQMDGLAVLPGHLELYV